MTPSESRSALAGQLAEAIAEISFDDPSTDAEMKDLVDRLRAPLRIVLAGRVSAGKSTLLNSLLGQRVAPTDQSECTEVVTWFQYGYPQRLEVRHTDGTTHELPLASGGLLPSKLGISPTDVSDVRAWLTNDALKNFTLVDTPGFASATRTDVDGDDPRDLRSRQAAAQCDAMVLVLNQNLRADELAVVRDFQGSQASALLGSNSIGVLTKADQLGDGSEDPVEVAAALAKRFAERYESHLADVIPLFGLLAETSRSGALTGNDYDVLHRLTQLGSEELEDLLDGPDSFVDNECDVSSEARERLLRRLDLFGLERALAMVREGAASSGPLSRELARISGIEELRSSLVGEFGSGATSLRLLDALETIEALSHRRGLDRHIGHRLRGIVERIRSDPDMHALREAAAFKAYSSGEVALPSRLADDLRLLTFSLDQASRVGALHDDPGAIREAALAGAARWREFRTFASPAQREIALTALRSYQLIYSSCQNTL